MGSDESSKCHGGWDLDVGNIRLLRRYMLKSNESDGAGIVKIMIFQCVLVNILLQTQKHYCGWDT